MSFYSYPNRLVCSVLQEMRDSLKVLDQDPSDLTLNRWRIHQNLLIEEAQTLVNRMESALEEWDDIRRAYDKIKELKKEINELEEKKESLENANDKSKKKNS